MNLKNRIELVNLTDETKINVYNKEIQKLNEVFKDIDENERQLVDGLIQEAATLRTELFFMEDVIKESGLLKVHPQDKSKQKALPIANEYRRTINVYAIVIKTLDSILNKNPVEQGDPLAEWLKTQKDRIYENTI